MKRGSITTNQRNKFQSSQWKRKHEGIPNIIKSAPSAGKWMATVFWDRKGILSIDWLPEKTTINSDYYISELEELREVIKRERRGNLANEFYSNMIMPGPMSAIKQTTHIRRLGFECLPHPPYCPDQAPSDYRLFGEMKIPLRGKRFSDFKQKERKINQ